MTEEVTAQNDLCVSQKGVSSLDFYLAPKYKDSKGSQKFYFHVYKKSDSHMKLGFPWADTRRRHNLIQFRHHYWRPSTPRNIWAIKIDIIKKNQMPIYVPESSKKKKKKSNRHHGSLWMAVSHVAAKLRNSLQVTKHRQGFILSSRGSQILTTSLLSLLLRQLLKLWRVYVLDFWKDFTS